MCNILQVTRSTTHIPGSNEAKSCEVIASLWTTSFLLCHAADTPSINICLQFTEAITRLRASASGICFDGDVSLTSAYFVPVTSRSWRQQASLLLSPQLAVCIAAQIASVHQVVGFVRRSYTSQGAVPAAMGHTYISRRSNAPEATWLHGDTICVKSKLSKHKY